MGTEGYWAVCEEYKVQSASAKSSAGVSLISVRGFFHADAMGPTRMEALRRTHEKLKENIRFYLSCGLDLPPLYTADTVPRDYKPKENTTLIFIALKDLGLDYLAAEQKKVAANGSFN